MNLLAIILIVIAGLLIVVIVAGIFLAQAQQRQMLNTAENMNRQLNAVSDIVNRQLNAVTEQMAASQKTIGDRLDSAVKVVADVHKGLGSLSEASTRIFEVGKDISKLHDILHAPKLRGGLGELLLGDLLAQVLPKQNYVLQKKFASGETVDAVIQLGQGMVPVDAKFPLENFRKLLDAPDEAEKKAQRRKFTADVKKHIDAIATKYILADEGTFDFALMYIPAENVYYETIIKDDIAGENADIAAYALQKHVIPVSPNSFYAYMQAIVLGLRGLRVEKSAQEILQHLSRLKGDFSRFQDEFDILGKHITNIKNKYDDSAKRLDNFGAKLAVTTENHPPDELPAPHPEI
ncbi:MAG: DNA recombination protein RmuC [Elusimicrobia bacterium]|nr:DNA recombination protein RmuC [Elusimicrobiota bacterium]